MIVNEETMFQQNLLKLLILAVLCFSFSFGDDKQPENSSEIKEAGKKADFSDTEVKALVHAFHEFRTAHTNARKAELMVDTK